MKKQLCSEFRKNLDALYERAHQAIEEARVEKSYSESLCESLADTITEVEKNAEEIKHHAHDLEAIYDAELVQNLIHHMFTSRSNPHCKISLLSAAKSQHELRDSSEIRDVILACALDEHYTDVMLMNIRQIGHSVDETLSELSD